MMNLGIYHLGTWYKCQTYQGKGNVMLPGVYQARKKDNTVYFRSNITYRNKHISLGSFETEKKAHEAYNEAWILLHGEDSIDQVVDYYMKTPAQVESAMDNVSQMTLSFEKCVSLINFREHNMYIANPIYMRKNYFSYYLSPTEELKFDIDDLFYYTRHKIMRRQGHLFVNDYGMQVTILSRYGLKSHAVCHRDYEFANGDPTDWRYSNIIVINRYHGVRVFEKNGKQRYRVLIHINGNYKVGTYTTEEKAAVAYNKAVDLARRAGVDRNYPENYIESLTASEYAAIYEKIKISQKYLGYLDNLPQEQKRKSCNGNPSEVFWDHSSAWEV